MKTIFIVKLTKHSLLMNGMTKISKINSYKSYNASNNKQEPNKLKTNSKESITTKQTKEIYAKTNNKNLLNSNLTDNILKKTIMTSFSNNKAIVIDQLENKH